MRIDVSQTPVPSEAPRPSEASASPEALFETPEQEDEADEFIPRPWVNVKPRFPWRPALIALSVVILVVVAVIFIKPDADVVNDPEADVALMAEAMPNLDRHDDTYEETDPTVEESGAETEGTEVEEDMEESLLDTLIVKVTENQIRANGKLVTLQDLSNLCELTEDTAMLKLINRRGDTKIVEAVVRVLDSSQLRYHYVNN